MANRYPDPTREDGERLLAAMRLLDAGVPRRKAALRVGINPNSLPGMVAARHQGQRRCRLTPS